MITLDIEQGSEAWFQARAGIPSASNLSKIITTKGEPSKQAEKYMHTLAIEAVTGTKEETYQSAAMARGVEMEAEARALYEMINDVQVEEVGFCFKDERKLYGCSPDGLIGDDGLIEIKCPSACTHCEYLLKGKLPSTYFQQVQMQLWVTGRKWCDFVSYFPGVRPLIVRVEPDLQFFSAMELELEKFCAKLADVVEKIK